MFKHVKVNKYMIITDYKKSNIILTIHQKNYYLCLLNHVSLLVLKSVLNDLKLGPFS